MKQKVVLFANTDWILYVHRLPLAQYLRAAGYEVVFAAPPGPYVEQIERAGFRFVSCPMSRRGTNPGAELLALGRIVRLFRREKPDVVHSFTAKSVLYGSLAARLAGVPKVVNSISGLGYVFTSADWQARLLRRPVERWYRVALRGSRVIFENPDDQRYFVEHAFIRSSEGHLIPGAGVDTEKLVPVPEPEGAPLVMLAGRMLRDKGVEEFVAAASILKRDGVAARFVLVGETDAGNPSAVPRSQLEAWRDAGVVEWWGFRDDMERVLLDTHVVCLPSLREGLPRILLEAGAVGRPLVATDAPGCREVVRDGDNGFLVPVQDPVALARAVRRLVEDKALRRRMGARAREIVAARFSLDLVAREVLRVYEMGPPGPATRSNGASERLPEHPASALP